MPKFAQVDAEGRLWQVTDLLPLEQVDTILNINWTGLATIKIPQQNFWLREQVHWNEPGIKSACDAITAQLPAINQAVGTTFTQCGGHFWIDQPGFDCPMHTDGELQNSMQIYWIAAGPEYGTGFYNNKRGDRLYQFASLVNTGYLMLNHLNEDGSQPLMWHAMFNPVPAGTIRVSSYWQFK